MTYAPPHSAIQARSMSRCLADIPDVDLRSYWLNCGHGTLFYYLALAELTQERAYAAVALYADRAEFDGTADLPEAFGRWIENGSY